MLQRQHGLSRMIRNLTQNVSRQLENCARGHELIDIGHVRQSDQSTVDLCRAE